MRYELFYISLQYTDAVVVGHCINDVLLVAHTRLQLRLQRQMQVLWVKFGSILERT